MAFNILYIEDQAAESRAQDLTNLGFNVTSYDPSSDIKEILSLITPETDALILDYRLTAGENNACFDAPTIAQTLRSKYSHDSASRSEVPIVLMSNESVITDYYNDFTSQDLFDFVLTKKEFIDNQRRFAVKLVSFINGYKTIKARDYDIRKILGLNENDEALIHPNLYIKTKQFDTHVFEYSKLVFDEIIRSIGPLIGQQILSARLGVSMDSKDWQELLEALKHTAYIGILSDAYERWWMAKINNWWHNELQIEAPLRRLNAEERVTIIQTALNLDLQPISKTEHSQSTNFWTISKLTNDPIDPFDGIELFKKDILPWQEKEYISIDLALNKIDEFKDFISPIDRKALRELSNQINAK